MMNQAVGHKSSVGPCPDSGDKHLGPVRCGVINAAGC